MSDYQIGKYTFNSESEYLTAKKEFNTIKTLSEKYNLKDPKVAKLIVSKFDPKTAIGETFVSNLKKTFEDEADEDLLASIDAALNNREEPKPDKTISKQSGVDFIAMKCPNCNSPLEISTGVNEYKCEHCGHIILLDDEARLNAHVKLKEIETDERKLDKTIELEKYKIQKEEEKEEKKRKLSKKSKRNLFLICAALVAFTLIAYAVDTKLHPHDLAVEAMVKTNSEDCIGQNFSIIAKEFADAGFESIETEPMNDLKKGLFNKDQKNNGLIARISIDGNSSFYSGQYFPKTATVRIAYHSFPNELPETSASEAEESSASIQETPVVAQNNAADKQETVTEKSEDKATKTELTPTTQTASSTDTSTASNTNESNATDQKTSGRISVTGDTDNSTKNVTYASDNWDYFAPGIIQSKVYPFADDCDYFAITGYGSFYFGDITLRYRAGNGPYDHGQTYDILFDYQMENNESSTPVMMTFWFRPTLTVDGKTYTMVEPPDSTYPMIMAQTLQSGQKTSVNTICFEGYDGDGNNPIPPISENSRIILNLTLQVKKSTDSSFLDVYTPIDLKTGDIAYDMVQYE